MPPAPYNPIPCRLAGLRRKWPRSSPRHASSPADAPTAALSDTRTRDDGRTATSGPATPAERSAAVPTTWRPASHAVWTWAPTGTAAPAVIHTQSDSRAIHDWPRFVDLDLDQ